MLTGATCRQVPAYSESWKDHSMSKSSLKKCLTQKYPELINKGDFFYFNRAQVLLRGFALDVPPSRTSVFTFVMPVFDKIDDLHLGLGSEAARLGPLGSNKIYAVCEQVEQLLREQSVMADNFDSLETFKEYCKILDQRGLYLKWCLALVACLEKRLDDARQQIDLLMSETNDGLVFPTSGLRDLHGVLHTSPEKAPSILAQWTTANIATFLS